MLDEYGFEYVAGSLLEFWGMRMCVAILKEIGTEKLARQNFSPSVRQRASGPFGIDPVYAV